MFIMKVNVVYIFYVLPQLKYKKTIKAKERGCYMVGNGLGIPFFQTFPEIQVQKAYYFSRT